MRVLVTGGLGFIGSAVVRLLIGETEHHVLNVDKVTYAANPASVKEVASNPRYRFAKADIADGAAMRGLFARISARRGAAPRRGVSRRSIDRWPRRVHHDQHRRNVRAARGGHGLLARPRSRCRAAFPAPARFDGRGIRVSRARRFAVQRAHCVLTALAVRREQGRIRSSRARMARNLRAAHAHHELLEQLRALSLPRKADSAHDSQSHAGRRAARVWQRRERPRLALRRRPRARHSLRARAREARTNLYRGRQRGKAEPRGRATDLRPARRHAGPAARGTAPSPHSLRRGSPGA